MAWKDEAQEAFARTGWFPQPDVAFNEDLLSPEEAYDAITPPAEGVEVALDARDVERRLACRSEREAQVTIARSVVKTIGGDAAVAGPLPVAENPHDVRMARVLQRALVK